MLQADTRTGTSCFATTCPPLLASKRFHSRPWRTSSRTRSPAQLRHLDQSVHRLHVLTSADVGTFSRTSRTERRGRLVRDRGGALLRRALARSHDWPWLEQLWDEDAAVPFARCFSAVEHGDYRPACARAGHVGPEVPAWPGRGGRGGLGAFTLPGTSAGRPVRRDRAPHVRAHAQHAGRVRAHPGRRRAQDAPARCGQRERECATRDGRAPPPPGRLCAAGGVAPLPGHPPTP
jgi:hypothetical protein